MNIDWRSFDWCINVDVTYELWLKFSKFVFLFKTSKIIHQSKDLVKLSWKILKVQIRFWPYLDFYSHKKNRKTILSGKSPKLGQQQKLASHNLAGPIFSKFWPGQNLTGPFMAGPVFSTLWLGQNLAGPLFGWVNFFYFLAGPKFGCNFAGQVLWQAHFCWAYGWVEIFFYSGWANNGPAIIGPVNFF